MSAGFTKGPWESRELVDDLDVAYSVDCGRNAIADVYQGANAKANARLIAAAPALYEALTTCLAMGERQLKQAMNLNGETPYDIGLAALKLARGEEA